VKIRETGHVRNKAIYVVIGVNMQGNKEVLGLWAGQAERLVSTTLRHSER
jgi:putative transposase